MAYSPAVHEPHPDLHASAGDQGHHLPAFVYYRTFAILMVLLIITVVMYYVDLEKYVHFKGLNLIVALIIAVVKAALVVLFFMNVKYSTRLTWLWASLGFVWLLLLGGVFMDYGTRASESPAGWQQTPYTRH